MAMGDCRELKSMYADWPGRELSRDGHASLNGNGRIDGIYLSVIALALPKPGPLRPGRSGCRKQADLAKAGVGQVAVAVRHRDSWIFPDHSFRTAGSGESEV